ncbi:MAG: amidase [Kofleriaceae bacterium]|nr:amidase [Kofleriaceae bacterium]
MSRFDELAHRFLARRRPGRALTWLARTPVPVLAADWIAEREPVGEENAPNPSPLIEEIAPRDAPAGVLDGDVVIKDQIDVAGLRTGVGMADGGEVATCDATVVARIVAAGGRITGKTKMTELGVDGIGALMHYPMPRNPVSPGYIAGGSSTGTAVAVASGFARYGVGGDGLGSIRIPSAFCGLVGLKPSQTALPRDGVRSPVRTLAQIGPMARTVEDCARLWQVMAGEPVTPLTAWAPPVVGIPAFVATTKVARSIGHAFKRMFTALGVESREVPLPGFENATFLGGLTGAHELASGPYAGRGTTAPGKVSLALGRSFTAEHIAILEAQRAALRDATARAFGQTPILAMPTTAIPAPAITPQLLTGRTSLPVLRALGAFTPLANLVDLPAIAVPSGVDDRGRPLSIMFVAPQGGETSLLRIAHAVEATGLGAMLA